MEPVLIYTNTRKINEEKQVLDKSVILYQAIYDAFFNLPITPNINYTLGLSDISALVQKQLRGTNGGDFLDDFVKSWVLGNSPDTTFGGLYLNTQMLKAMLVVPDLTALKSALFNAPGVYQGGTRGTDITMLGLANQIVSKAVDAYSRIEAKYTYYTQTDAGVTLFNRVKAVCDALNTFEGYYDDFFVVHFGLLNTSDTSNGINPIRGIDYIDDTWVVSYKFIQNFELTGSLSAKV